MTQDTSQGYVPASYPLMLYGASVDHQIVVNDEAEESEARKKGFTDFHRIDAEKDGLELRDAPFLIDRALVLIRADLGRLSSEELLATVRKMEAAEQDRLAAVQAKDAAKAAADADANALALAAQQEALAADDEPKGQWVDANMVRFQEADLVPVGRWATADHDAALDNLSDDALRDLIAKATGRQPHPATGRPKLLIAAAAALAKAPNTSEEG